VGPILSHENRVLLVARDDPFADRESVCYSDFADRVLPDAPGMPREMMDSFITRSTPSGLQTRRLAIRSFEAMLLLVASGNLVHATVASFLNHYIHDGVSPCRSATCPHRKPPLPG
jgi:hypothetical protein